jgi:hypothetical protein
MRASVRVTCDFISGLSVLGMKTVDKNIDKKNKQWFGCFNNSVDSNVHFHCIRMCFTPQIIACFSYRCSYLRFLYPFGPRAESATFLFATMIFTKAIISL